MCMHTKFALQQPLGVRAESELPPDAIHHCACVDQVMIVDNCRYLKRIDDAVNSVKTQTDGAPVTLLAHSAGGWLSRVYLHSSGTAGIDRLVTIGSPHSPPPQVC